MDKVIPIAAVNNYQCPGCIHGPDAETCPKSNVTNQGCTNHYPGTIMLGRGTIALGLPVGFNRFGPNPTAAVEVHASYDEMLEIHQNLKSKYSLPIWKHLDAQGNTITRWFSPRTNMGWSSVILGNCLDRMPTAVELFQSDIDDMD
jgi:hypothetical protein